MILIAESGSTKCDWVLIDNIGQEIGRMYTIGLNPFFHTTEMVKEAINGNEGLRMWADKITQTYFYGAGCSAQPLREIIKRGLDAVFTKGNNNVGHDLEAAAYALYNGEPVVSCILGTGSNCCFFNGQTIVQNTPSLGFILGDEGSGSHLGKKIMTDFLYHKMPADLANVFQKQFDLSLETVIDTVYRKPHANVYLAQFAHFLSDHIYEEYCQNVLRHSFSVFIKTHVLSYASNRNISVGFVGSIAHAFSPIIQDVLKIHGLKAGKIIAKPIDELVKYHAEKIKLTNERLDE